MCADCSTCCVEKDPARLVLDLDGMESQTNQGTGVRGGSVCKRGCGLLLSHEDIRKGEHCCVDALRTVTDSLEERSAALQHEARMAKLRWNRREQNLLNQVSALQSENHLAALKYQRRLHQYMLHINSIAEQVTEYCKGDPRTDADLQSQISDKATCAEGEEKVTEPELGKTAPKFLSLSADQHCARLDGRNHRASVGGAASATGARGLIVACFISGCQSGSSQATCRKNGLSLVLLR
ncbi:E3 ubiquitin-protein ligase PDZRN3-B [Channa argus]|uniref:E3 ubiquitin-protein ligase PDZRN3-B n=1 Tax=Channa argus TaxID=215402 RepID=A0A6G1PEE2_CHAAH|nr:E3 ubiquitin-protein ligase PDZRN3-B [Channa argus]